MAKKIEKLRHNLSPRGDGNCGVVAGVVDQIGHNLSPRGDGNRDFCRNLRRALDTTYPREGTETILHFTGEAFA